ncbi:MAG: copper-binding protein, partial [Candidatus Methylomirabilis sp.]
MDIRVRSCGRWLLSLAILLSLCLAAAELQAQDRYQGEGRVLGVDEEKRMLFLAHGPIPGFMPAPMRHGFEVHRIELLRGLQKGDMVRFVLEVQNEIIGISIIEQ